MSQNNSTRRKFLQFIGLTASATVISKSALANFTNHTEILKLNSVQQEFMIRYGEWMDEFTEVVRIQKTAPDDIENHKKMIALTQKVAAFQPELTEFMKDETFSLIYRVSIERMTKEI